MRVFFNKIIEAGLDAIGAGIEWLEPRPLRLIVAYAIGVNLLIIAVEFAWPEVK